ncbi:MAG: hypothetical protein RMA76_10755 [Deltaproteobacteria bacterium]|jgi:hypothetical protein
MKKVALVLFVLLAVLSWGVVGRSQADDVGTDCKAEAGPLCFYWERNAVGKTMDAAGDALDKAKKAFE